MFTPSTIVSYPNGREDSIYFIPSSVKTIHHSAFRGNEHLEKIIIQSGLTTIEEFGFYDMYKLNVVYQ